MRSDFATTSMVRTVLQRSRVAYKAPEGTRDSVPILIGYSAYWIVDREGHEPRNLDA